MILLIYISWQIVAITWYIWLWSAVDSFDRWSKVEAMSLVRTTAFALWYHVCSALTFWVSLRLRYLFLKKSWTQSMFVCLRYFYSIPCRHKHILLMLIPRYVTYAWLVLLYMESCCRQKNELSHWCARSTCQLSRTSQPARSFVDCWLRGWRSWFSCINLAYDWGYFST